MGSQTDSRVTDQIQVTSKPFPFKDRCNLPGPSHPGACYPWIPLLNSTRWTKASGCGPAHGWQLCFLVRLEPALLTPSVLSSQRPVVGEDPQTHEGGFCVFLEPLCPVPPGFDAMARFRASSTLPYTYQPVSALTVAPDLAPALQAV